jgi:hypothetical protein
MVLIDARESGDSTVVSLRLGHSVPEEVVRLSREAEIFYADLPAEKPAKFAAEGKWVREMMSEEYIRQFMFPLEGVLMVVAAEGLESILHREADRLERTYFADRKR